MPLDIVIGTQWGDEGKGRVVDLLSENSHLVARYNGGDNAGHTVTVADKIYKLHVIPTGVIHLQTICILGNGMVINPATVIEEMDMLRSVGVEINPFRLMISDAAQLITPGHRLLDRAQDAALGKNQIGTTGRGIGPAYVDKAARSGLRVGDILDHQSFPDRLRAHFTEINKRLSALFSQPEIDVEKYTAEYLEKAESLRPYIKRIGPEIQTALKMGKTVLAEGAQGSLLDLEQGTYPFVTSSCTTAAGIFSGLGIGIQPVRKVVGVAKAFQTRVGSGPFPTEQTGEIANFLRGSGSKPWDEFGTTTGRPRRVGWLDLVLLRYTQEINGLTELFLTKLDILSGLEQIQVCVAFERNGKKIETLDFSCDAKSLAQCLPVYESLPGWKEDLSLCRRWKDLPANARAYIEAIEEKTGIPITTISVGSERTATIYRD
ncbi:MAG: adenylosuccinate synthase [Anaerolineaceae bacterium]|nr:adenylosuccinate synthase [Anaerolineaceae bacterium]